MLYPTTPYLEISVLYLSDRYHGKGGWPPSPARLFQALVAAGRKSTSPGEWANSAAPSLKWLEERPAPHILALDPIGSGSFVTAGPRNQADKAVKPTEINMSTMRAQRDLKSFSHRCLPDEIQKRFVYYLWPLSPTVIENGKSEAVCRIARKISHLGYGIDQAVGNSRITLGDQIAQEGYHLYEPSESPTSLRLEVPVKGYLENLVDLYEKRRNRLRSGVVHIYFRPEQYRLVYYRKEGEMMLTRPAAAFALKSSDGSGRPISVRWQDSAMTVAPWARHAVGVLARREGLAQEGIDQFILGHTPEGKRDQRLSYLPLPSIGHQHSDGRIRRFAVAEPFGSDGKAIEMIEWGLPYSLLLNVDGEVVARPEVLSIRKDTLLKYYFEKSTHWTTVTPMIMHGQVYQRGKFAPRKLDKLLLDAFSDAGYPQDSIQNLDFKRAPYWFGCGDARLMRVPKHLDRWPRYHVSVVFRTPVVGPVIAGIGRHYGLGLFARNRARNDTSRQ